MGYLMSVNFVFMNEIKTISDRIELRIKQIGTTKAKIARKIGVNSPQTFSNWIARNSVPKEYLISLSEVLGVQFKWLQFGIGAVNSNIAGLEDSVDDIATDEVLAVLAREYVEIKQYNDVFGSMGNGLITDGDSQSTITSWRVTPEWANHNIPANTGVKNLRIVTGRGDSMKGMFNDGDPIIVDVGINAVDYDAVYFFRIGERGYIKRLQGIPDGSILAISKNTEYRDMIITHDLDFEVYGRVLKVWQGESF